MKKLLILTMLLIGLTSCEREEIGLNCSEITNISFVGGTGYYMNLENGQIIHTGYVLPEYEIGDQYCLD